MTESEFTKALSDDIIEVLKKYNIYLKDGNVTLVNTVVDDRKLRHVIELGDSYYEKQLTIGFVYRQLAPIMTVEDEQIFVNSYHPRFPNMRKETNYITGETSITCDGIPVKKKTSWLDRVKKCWSRK